MGSLISALLFNFVSINYSFDHLQIKLHVIFIDRVASTQRVETAKYFLSAGEFDLRTLQQGDMKIQFFKANKIIKHPSFISAEEGNDIALVYLDREANWTDVIRPICLAADQDLSFAGVMATVAGWGTTELDEAGKGKNASDILKNVDLPIIHNKQCKQWMEEELGRAVSVVDTVMCAGLKQGGRDTCTGDSGGPLMVKHWSGRYVQAGIPSWGFSCGRAKLPGVYTRIASHIDWIVSIIEKQKFIETNQMFSRNEIR